MSAGSTARRRSASLKARLAGRQRPTLVYPLLVDADAHVEAVTALDEAVRAWRQVALRDDNDSERLAAQSTVDAARAAVDACFEQIRLQAMPPAEYERLIAAHPPTDEQRGKGEIWNPDSFRAALLAACTAGDMTEQDWAEFLAERCSTAERQGLFVAALAVNEQERVAESLTVPKGWTPTRS